MFVIDTAKIIVILISTLVNSQLVWRIWRRKHLHTVFNLGYCYYFALAGTISIFLFHEYGSVISSFIESGETSSCSCRWLGIDYFAAYLNSKVFLANLIFRYVIIKYSHYGMGKTGGLVDTKGWIIKLLYFTFLLSYGFMVYLGFLLKFGKDESSTNLYLKGRICLLERYFCVCCELG